MATRERVAWIFHEKARRLHAEVSNGKAGLHVVLGRGILQERDRKEGGPALCGAAARPSARARSQARRSTAPNGDAVRGTGKRGPRFRAPFCGTSSFEGGPARNRVVFINSGRGRREKGRRPEAVLTPAWHYAYGRSLPPSARVGRCPSRALQGPSVDENLPISGRCRQFFCNRSSWE